MEEMPLLLAVFLLVAPSLVAQPGGISAARLRAHVKFLSSDLMEGRGIGERGGRLATEYLATQFELAGAKPAGPNGSYYQNVALVGVRTVAAGTSIRVPGLTGGAAEFKWLDEVVGVNQRHVRQSQAAAEAVFVGHGITAPEFGWDDFKDVDVRGKVLVMFTNEPPSTDSAFFGGRALTYYGRWTYKYEEALRRGALGALIIHTTPTAGYGWNVVRNSWGGEQPFVRLSPGQPALEFAGWLSQQAGARLVAGTGRTLEQLLAAAGSRDFRPIPLGVRVEMTTRSEIREIQTRNVAALVSGSDPALSSEAVIYSAHWDHLGIGPAVNGDRIYNGAVDNATGCAILLEMARAWAELPQKPRRSALFLAVTAEEGGLRGSEFYAMNPLVAPGKTAAALNYDGLFPLGRPMDLVVNGAERTTLWPLVQEVARRFALTVKPDPHPEQGHFYRSDHFPLAHAGIPAFSVGQGTEFAGKPEGFGEKLYNEFNEKHYHQPSDEYREDWDFTGLERLAQFGFVLGMETANQDALPTWRPGDEFLAAREKSGVRGGRAR